jgi:hypothetical protein
MITEIAQIEVKPGLEAEFEAAVKKAAPVERLPRHGVAALRREAEPLPAVRDLGHG